MTKKWKHFYQSLEELFDSFERVEKIQEIIILGVDGGIRRLIMEDNNEIK